MTQPYLLKTRDRPARPLPATLNRGDIVAFLKLFVKDLASRGMLHRNLGRPTSIVKVPSRRTATMARWSFPLFDTKAVPNPLGGDCGLAPVPRFSLYGFDPLTASHTTHRTSLAASLSDLPRA